jgi:hypothetical protein
LDCQCDESYYRNIEAVTICNECPKDHYCAGGSEAPIKNPSIPFQLIPINGGTIHGTLSLSLSFGQCPTH